MLMYQGSLFDMQFKNGKLMLRDAQYEEPVLVYGDASGSWFVGVAELLKGLSLPRRYPTGFGHYQGRLLSVGPFTSARETAEGGLEIYRNDFGGAGPFLFSPQELGQIREFLLNVR